MTRILCALLLIAGFFLLLGVHPFDMAQPFAKPFERQREKKNKIRRITGKPKGKLAATVDDAKAMLTAANMDTVPARPAVKIRPSRHREPAWGNAPCADGSGHGHSKAAWGLHRHGHAGAWRDSVDGSHDARLVYHAHHHARGQNHAGRGAGRYSGDGHMGGAAIPPDRRW